MPVWVGIRRGMAMSFVVYAVGAVVALWIALPVAVATSRFLDGAAWEGPLRQEALRELAGSLEAQSAALTVGGVVFVLISPWLQMAWLAAMSTGASPGAALQAGAQRYFSAWLTSALVTVAWLVPAAIIGGIAWMLHSQLGSQPNARIHDVAVASVCILWLPLSLFAWVWHDVARAACLQLSPWHAVLHSARTMRQPELWWWWLACSTLGIALVALADRGTQWWGGPYPTLAATLLVQGAALARTVLRSRWLVAALTAVMPHEPAPAYEGMYDAEALED